MMGTVRRTLGTLCAGVVAVGTLGVASPVEAVVTTSGAARTVTVTVKGGQNLTLLLVSGKGRTLASARITKATQAVRLRTPSVSTTKGMNLQLVSTGGVARGEYFGPVVLGWKGTKSSSASTVYTRMKSATAKTISLGTVTVSKVGASKRQGFAMAAKKVALADTSSLVSVKATRGRPAGVGSYGKSGGVKRSSVGAFDAVGPPPGGPSQGEGPAVDESGTLGGDKDSDGIPNAFDVDDDADGMLDASDPSTPAPMVSADDGSTDCGSITWRIFTNFKATQPNYQGTINAYGSGPSEATRDRIAAAITDTMTMVFQPITRVCGSAVVKTEIKGNGVPYAPEAYQEVASTCSTGDYQWYIGKGRMCDAVAGGGYSFGNPYSFSGADLPSGQDTFSVRVTTDDGRSFEFTSSPGFVFVTHPMLVSYDAGAGVRAVEYDGSIEPISIGDSSELTLTFYRPQRLAFDGEPGTFYDLGGYKYSPDIPNGFGGGQGPGKCDSQSVVDTTMASDRAIDTATKPTFTVKWRIGGCFSSGGKPWGTGPLTLDIQVEPAGPGGNSAQKLFLTGL